MGGGGGGRGNLMTGGMKKKDRERNKLEQKFLFSLEAKKRKGSEYDEQWR